MITVALIAYIAATAVGMFSGSFVSFWYIVLPAWVAGGGVGAFAAAFTNAMRESNGQPSMSPKSTAETFSGASAGTMWGALAGSFAASTCGPTHARSLLGSEVSAVVMALVAIALVLVADMLPRVIAMRPHALCGLLFLSTVGLALALGAEVPRWP